MTFSRLDRGLGAAHYVGQTVRGRVVAERLRRALPGRGRPLVDARQPREYARGTHPRRHNLPCSATDERAEIRHASTANGAVSRPLMLATGPGGRRAWPTWRKGLRALQGLVRGAGRKRALACASMGRWACVQRAFAWLAETSDLPVLLLRKGLTRCIAHWCCPNSRQAWALALLGGRHRTGKTDLLLSLEAPAAVGVRGFSRAWPITVAAASAASVLPPSEQPNTSKIAGRQWLVWPPPIFWLEPSSVQGVAAGSRRPLAAGAGSTAAGAAPPSTSACGGLVGVRASQTRRPGRGTTRIAGRLGRSGPG